jgi:hypothetical protein
MPVPFRDSQDVAAVAEGLGAADNVTVTTSRQGLGATRLRAKRFGATRRERAPGTVSRRGGALSIVVELLMSVRRRDDLLTLREDRLLVDGSFAGR